MDYLNKHQAALTVSIYTIIQIICRLILSLEVIFALKMGINGSLLVIITAILAYYLHFTKYIVIGTTLLFAFLLSLHYPYMIALPTCYKMGLSLFDLSSLLVSYAIG